MRMYPYMAYLLECHTAYFEPPYKNYRVDLLGHFFIKQEIRRKRLKRLAVILTCLTVRRIHPEIVESAETDAFINAFERFTNHRSCPQIVYSDCRINFEGLTADLEEFVWDLEKDPFQKLLQI